MTTCSHTYDYGGCHTKFSLFSWNAVLYTQVSHSNLHTGHSSRLSSFGMPTKTASSLASLCDVNPACRSDESGSVSEFPIMHNNSLSSSRHCSFVCQSQLFKSAKFACQALDCFVLPTSCSALADLYDENTGSMSELPSILLARKGGR